VIKEADGMSVFYGPPFCTEKSMVTLPFCEIPKTITKFSKILSTLSFLMEHLKEKTVTFLWKFFHWVALHF